MNEVLRILADMFKLGLERFGLYYSVYMAYVEDNEDPEGYGRLKLRIPIVTGKNVYNYWAWPRSNFAGKGYGMQCIPQKGDLVRVEFELGNPRLPIWSYGYFAKKDGEKEKPEELKEVTNFWFKTPSGHLVELDDKEGSEEIRITHKDGYKHIIKTNEIFSGSDYNNKQAIPLGNNLQDTLNQISSSLGSIATMLNTIGTTDSATSGTLGLTYASTMNSVALTLQTDVANLNNLINQIKSTNNFID